MNNGHGLGASLAKGIDVGHHVVPHLPLLALRQLIVDVLQVGAHLLQLLILDRQPLLVPQPCTCTFTNLRHTIMKDGAYEFLLGLSEG